VKVFLIGEYVAIPYIWERLLVRCSGQLLRNWTNEARSVTHRIHCSAHTLNHEDLIAFIAIDTWPLRHTIAMRSIQVKRFVTHPGVLLFNCAHCYWSEPLMGLVIFTIATLVVRVEQSFMKSNTGS